MNLLMQTFHTWIQPEIDNTDHTQMRNIHVGQSNIAGNQDKQTQLG